MATVIVGCKLPNGLVAEHKGVQVALNGANTSEIIGGYGITQGVDKDFIDGWLAAEKDTPLVRNGLVFQVSNEKDAKAAAADGEKSKTGLEGLDQDKPAAGVEKSK